MFIQLQLLKTGATSILPICYFKLQNRTEQEAKWATVIQLTILLKTIYIQTNHVILRNNNRNTALERSAIKVAPSAADIIGDDMSTHAQSDPMDDGDAHDPN